jgi:prepilin-type N-terminal cleavage/methylation domain-containing protein
VHAAKLSILREGFTLVELLVVLTTILILAGVVLAAAGFVAKKGARTRAESEMAALAAALESYKADNGTYPRGNASSPSTNPPYDTDNLDAQKNGDPTAAPRPNAYEKASQFLYGQLSGDYDNSDPTASTNYNNVIDTTNEKANRAYFTFTPSMLSISSVTTTSPPRTTITVNFIRDPFGYPYGYSTAYTASPNGSFGYNPTYDLWSTAGVISTSVPSPTEQAQWIKNW